MSQSRPLNAIYHVFFGFLILLLNRDIGQVENGCVIAALFDLFGKAGTHSGFNENFFSFQVMLHISRLRFLKAYFNNTLLRSGSWICHNERCVHLSVTYSSGELWDSPIMPYAVCRLTCGNSSTIWPKPTTDPVLSRDVVPIRANQFFFSIVDCEENEVRSQTVYMIIIPIIVYRLIL